MRTPIDIEQAHYGGSNMDGEDLVVKRTVLVLSNVVKSARRAEVVRSSSILWLLLLVPCMTACAPSDVVVREDVVGGWVPSGSPDTGSSWSLRADGSFTATDWPIDTFCSPEEITSAAEIDWARTDDFSGTWRIDDSGFLNIEYSGASCSAFDLSEVSRVDGGIRIRMLFTSADDAVPSDYLVLVKDA